ncbi:MAG: asparagine synthase (glutamine-hydrolyzing) [Ignavibacteria bacterium]|nr:asparagine synthase (glutamine-hydrolyzing) [Ignavibacteria bacterium]
MCGIAGIYRFDKRQISESDIKKMTNSMIHRGPDDDGIFVEGALGIGMRRLSIIDVEGGHQPLTNEEGNLHLVMNGEIYNYIELRAELTAKGHKFSTGSDAEVILHLYEDKGFGALEELNGMFAFALYDSNDHSLWVARDRLGIKPLFFVKTSEYFAFSSDIKSLRTQYPSFVSWERTIEYLTLGYIPEEQTMWDGISKLLPGNHAKINSYGEVKISPYWSINNFGTWHGSLNEAEEQLENLLNDAVKLQLRTDVPFGAFLSGGIDSSAIVAIASGQLREPLKTFTMDFEGKESSGDSFFAKQVSARYATEHFNLKMTSQDAMKALDELLGIIDEPLGDSALIPVYSLSKFAREQGVKVLLNGAGGDEIFGGYARHWKPRFPTPAWVSENVPQPFRTVLAKTWSVFQPQRGIRASDPRISWGVSISGVDINALSDIIKHNNTFGEISRTLFKEHSALAEPDTNINSSSYQRLLMDIKNYLPDNILSLTDKATMAASVEGRVPLLDHRLVEFAFALPHKTNLLDSPKGLFKKVAGKWLPQELFNRKKEGFNPPDQGWFGQSLTSMISDELLGNPGEILRNMIELGKLEKLLKDPKRTKHAATTLYSLYLFNKWHRKQDD